jgi:hypothetical protein
VTKESKANQVMLKDGDSANTGNSSPKQPRLALTHVPEVVTLLEFVAWVVLGGVPASVRSANWFKGRGGFLADQLDAVREASVRIQVWSCC